MAIDKNSFVAYTDWIDIFEELEDDEAGRLAKHLWRYVNDMNPITNDKIVRVSFTTIKNTLKRDLVKYEAIKDRNRKNGEKGGRPKKPTGLIENPQEPQKADSVSVLVPDSVTVIEEQKQPVFNFSKSLLGLGVEKQIVSDYLKVRSKKKASNTETAFNSIKSQLEKSKLSANESIKIAVIKSWAGFKAEWINNLDNENNQQGQKRQGQSGALGNEEGYDNGHNFTVHE